MSTRFESSSLSQIMADSAVTKASENFIRIIIRRPHAYQFRQMFRGKEIPIPGIIVLDAERKLVSTSSIESAMELAEKLGSLAK